MPVPSLIWVDLRHAQTSVSLQNAFAQEFDLYPPDDSCSEPPCGICFDFDYPDLHDLHQLQKIRQQHPGLPVILMSEQHSEALLLWALRARIWEVLVKPVTAQQAAEQVRALRYQLSSGSLAHEICLRPSPILRMPEEVRYIDTSHESRQLNPAISYISGHLAEKISENMVAELCGMRPFQFSRTFKKNFRITFQEFVQRARVQEAMRLLQSPNMQMLDVALAVGFKDQSYFSRVFKRISGLTPSQFQGQLKQGDKIPQLLPELPIREAGMATSTERQPSQPLQNSLKLFNMHE